MLSPTAGRLTTFFLYLITILRDCEVRRGIARRGICHDGRGPDLAGADCDLLRAVAESPGFALFPRNWVTI